MNILVLNGSPTGPKSSTLHSVHWLARQLPEHRFEIAEIGRGLGRLERDREAFDALVARMRAADGILWSWPVYTYLVPGPQKRFIELLFERCGHDSFAGTPTTSLSTSAHFFDHSAHAYMEEVCVDLGLRVLRGFSADMEDLVDPEQRAQLLGFGRRFVDAIAGGAPWEPGSPRPRWREQPYRADALQPAVKLAGPRVVVLTDARAQDRGLRAMIDALDAQLPFAVQEVNLHSIGIQGPCLGCMRCVYDGSCVYRDGFAPTFDQVISTGDVLVLAARIEDRYLSSTFKTYFDRCYRNGHRRVLTGQPMAWLVSGPLEQLGNLRHIIEGLIEVGAAPRLGVVSDHRGSDAEVSAAIGALADEIVRWQAQPFARPQTFLGVGGHKVFRDLVYGIRGIAVADHRFYRERGEYDFPQRNLRRRAFNKVMGLAMRLPPTRARTLAHLTELKLRPLQKVLDEDASQGDLLRRLRALPLWQRARQWAGATRPAG